MGDVEIAMRNGVVIIEDDFWPTAIFVLAINSVASVLLEHRKRGGRRPVLNGSTSLTRKVLVRAEPIQLAMISSI